jgi:hypothetical protein
MFRKIGVGYVVKEATRSEVRVLGVFESRDLATTFCEDRILHYRVHHEENWERKGLFTWGNDRNNCGRACSGACDMFAPGLICRPESKEGVPIWLAVSEVPRWGLPEWQQAAPM